jgi:mycofactocin precursor
LILALDDDNVLPYSTRCAEYQGKRGADMADLTETLDPTPSPTPATVPDDAAVVVDDLLVEEVSIDGMCGVY